jgi:2-polyprenyl-6-hydroxyphenyl methylase/3-demethylubiquinone-9 3-methyltransferase
MLDSHFSFGKNWSAFLRHQVDSDRIAIAVRDTSAFLGLRDLKRLTFMDIGCGSGLFSYAAHTLAAEHIISFDIDPLAVQCCLHMKERAGNPENWEIFQGSILDPKTLEHLPAVDVVYSWGVLHHTGDMWTAMRNAAQFVKPGGRLFISIYNRLEYDSFTSYRGSHGWLRLKRAYNRHGSLGKRAMECWFAGKDIAASLLSLRNPLHQIRQYRNKRGMSWWYDIVDWLGGYPYEFASAGEIFEFCHHELGLTLQRLRTTSSIGCNEFLFMRTAAGPSLGSPSDTRSAACSSDDTGR